MKSTVKSLWTGVSRLSFARPCLHRLWIRSCWLCKYFCQCITFVLIQHPASCLLGCLILTSAGTSLLLSFESLLCFFLCFFSLRRLCLRRFRASRWSGIRSELQPSLALLFFLTGKYCSSVFRLLLKTALLLALVRFWCFLVHSIHSGTLLF